MNGRIGIELLHQRKHLGLAGGVGQFIFFRVHSHGDGLLGLLCHIDLAAGIVADNDHGETGGDAMIGLEALHMAGNTAAQSFGKALSVDDPGCHATSPWQ